MEDECLRHGRYTYDPRRVMMGYVNPPGRTRVEIYWNHLIRDGATEFSYGYFYEDEKMTPEAFRFLASFDFPAPVAFDIDWLFTNRIVEVLANFQDEYGISDLAQFRVMLALSDFYSKNNIPRVDST